MPTLMWCAVLVAAAFVLAYAVMRLSRVGAWPLLFVGLIWGLYALWEWNAVVQEWDIRVDLFLIFPFLFVVSVIGISVFCLWTGTEDAD